MKSWMHSTVVKFLAFLLTALSMVAAATGIAGVAVMEDNGLYTRDLDSFHRDWLNQAAQQIGREFAGRYVAEKLGGCSEALLDRLYDDGSQVIAREYWSCSLSQNGWVVRESGNLVADPVELTFSYTTEYPVPTVIPLDYDYSGDTQLPAPDELTLYVSRVSVWEANRLVNYRLDYHSGPSYTITVRINSGEALQVRKTAVENVYPYRYGFIAVALVGLLLSAAGLVFLLSVSGKDAAGKPRLRGLNRLPLDAVLVFAGGIGGALISVVLAGISAWGRDGLDAALLTLLGLCGMGIALAVTTFLYILSAQTRFGSYGWQHCLCRRIAGRIRVMTASLGKTLPLMWQWLLIAAFLAILVVIAVIVPVSGVPNGWIWAAAALLAATCVVVYLGFCLGTLLAGIRRMSEGNLSDHIPTDRLSGLSLEAAEGINALSGVAMRAATEQLRSERMKTELITNVTHDIKTPLTSIINFVDLLRKPHTPQEESQYLDVLARQSARMKRLIEDLIDLSKATTGNMTVCLQELDMDEAVTQALGEFSDRLAAAGLTPVLRKGSGSFLVRADGRHTWRVLQNLLSNAEKYAMSGTRLYIDLINSNGEVLLSVKNVSRDALQLPPEELLDRFVQGDTARSGDGSGLGLNIARSLMEVQGGRLLLELDGDLFKTTLIFPQA